MKEILSASAAESKLHRMAIEVAERNHQTESLVLVGIKENGMHIAGQIAAYLRSYFKGEVILLALEINKREPTEVNAGSLLSLQGRNVILIDDVANSGRTMLYALAPIIAQKPRQVETLALIERSHKKFPIAINYVGLSISTTKEEHIEVEFKGEKIRGAWLR